MNITDCTPRTRLDAPTPAGDVSEAEQAWRLLAPAIAGRPRVRVSRDGGRTYPAGVERALSEQLPDRPAAVLLFGDDAAAHCLAADFDSSRGGPDQVERDATGFADLITACGGSLFADVSPNGGRHVYVLWSRPRPLAELRPLMRALGGLFPSLDAVPMLNAAAGCIRPPGARHRTGGHQRLTTPLPEALAAVANPCGPQVWNALLDRLSPALDEDHDPDSGREMRETTLAPAVDRLPGRIEQIARSGVWDADRYRSASEARQAVITAAAAAGWSLAQVAARMETGRWPGLSGHYARYSPRTRRTAIGRDLRKAHAYLARERNTHNSNTRGRTHSGGMQGGVAKQHRDLELFSEFRWIRAWWNAVRATETNRWSGRSGLSKRLVLRALGAMAQRRGTRVLDVGVRSLALACGLDHSTVSVVLRALREEPDPVIDLVEVGRGERADRYSLRVPEAGLHAALWRRWRPGAIEAIHPVFRELGPTAALVHETLTAEPIRCTEVVRTAVLAPRTVEGALKVLAEHGLAERDPDTGWRRGAADLDRLATTLGVGEVVEALVARYRTERAAWRDLLERIGRRSLTPAPRPRAAGPLVWPAVPIAPPPIDDNEVAYDLALAATGPPGLRTDHDAAVELARLEFRATVTAAGRY